MSSLQPFAMSSLSSSAATASASSSSFHPLSLQTPVFAPSAEVTPNSLNKQRPLTTTEHDRLKSLLEEKFLIGRNGEPFSDFLSSFITFIQKELLDLNAFTQIVLKGGAANFVLLGDRISYSDIDIGLELNEHISLKDIKQILHDWSVKNGIRLCALKLIPNKFLIVTLPGIPKNIDIQFTLSCPHQCTCSYNSLRIDFFPTLYSLKKELSITSPVNYHSFVFTGNHYPLDMALCDLHENRSQAVNPLEIFEGLRAHCRLLTKGIVPRRLEDEFGFTKGLEVQYSRDNYQALQFSLLQFLPRHFTENSSLIIYLLNYENIIKRSTIHDKITVQYYLVSLILDHMGCCEDHFKESDGTINIRRIENFIEHCYDYLNSSFKGQETYLIVGDLKFCVLPINPKNSIYLVIPKLNRSDRKRLLENPLDPLNEKYFIRFVEIFNKIRPSYSVGLEVSRSSSLSLSCVGPVSSMSASVSSGSNSGSSSPGSSSSGSSSPASEHAEKTIAMLSNLTIPIIERASQATSLFNTYSLLSTAQRKAHIELIKAIMNQLIEENLSVQATHLFIQLLKTRSYEKIEDPSTQLNQSITLRLWHSLFFAKKALAATQITVIHLQTAISLFQQLCETSRVPEKLLKELSMSFPEISLDGNDDKQLIETLVDTLLNTKKKLDHLTQKELRNKILKMISSPAMFTVTLDILWNKCQIQKETYNEIYYIELKRIVLLFSENIFQYPEHVNGAEDSKWDYVAKLFRNFLQTYEYQPGAEHKNPLIDDLFIKNMTQSLYLRIQTDLFKLPFERFYPFYQALLHSALSIALIPQPYSEAIEASAKHLKKQSSENESSEEIILKMFLEPILQKFPFIRTLFKQQLSKTDQRDIFEKLKDFLPESAALLEDLKNSASSYRKLRKFFISFYHSSVEPHSLAINEVNELFEQEEKRLIFLIAQKAQANNKVQLENTLSEVVEQHLILLISLDPKPVLNLFRKTLNKGWIKFVQFKSLYTHLCRYFFLVENGLRDLNLVCRSTKINEIYQFYRCAISIRINLEKSCLTYAFENPDELVEDFKELNRLKKTSTNEVKEELESILHQLQTLLENSSSRDTLKQLERIKPLLTMLKESSSYLTRIINPSKYLNILTIHYQAIEQRLQCLEAVEDITESQKDITELCENAGWCIEMSCVFPPLDNKPIIFLQMAISLLEEVRNYNKKISVLSSNKKAVLEKDTLHFIDNKLKKCYKSLVNLLYTLNNIPYFIETLEFYHKVLLLHPNSLELHSELYPALFLPKTDDQSTPNPQLEIKAKTTNVQVLYTLAEAHAKKQNYLQAVAHFEKAFQSNHRCIDITTIHKYCSYLIFLKKWDKALFYFKQIPNSKNNKFIPILELIIKWTQKQQHASQGETSTTHFSSFLRQYLTTTSLDSTYFAHSLLALLKQQQISRREIQANAAASASPAFCWIGAHRDKDYVQSEQADEESTILGFVIYQLVEDLYSEGNASIAFKVLTKSLERLHFEYFFNPCLTRSEPFVDVVLSILKSESSYPTEIYHLAFLICAKLTQYDPIKFEAYKELIFEKLNDNPLLISPLKSQLLYDLKHSLELHEENIDQDPENTQHSEAFLRLIDLHISAMLMEAFHWRKSEDIVEKLSEKMFVFTLNFIECAFKTTTIPLLLNYKNTLNLVMFHDAFVHFNYVVNLAERFFQDNFSVTLENIFQQLCILNRIQVSRIEIKQEIFNLNYQILAKLLALSYNNQPASNPSLSSSTQQPSGIIVQKIYLLYIFNEILQSIDSKILIKQFKYLTNRFTDIRKLYKEQSEQTHEAKEQISKALIKMGALQKTLTLIKTEKTIDSLSSAKGPSPSALSASATSTSPSSSNITYRFEQRDEQTLQYDCLHQGALVLQEGSEVIKKGELLLKENKPQALKEFRSAINILESASSMLELLRQTAARSVKEAHSQTQLAQERLNLDNYSRILADLYIKLEYCYLQINDENLFQRGLNFFKLSLITNPTSNEIICGIVTCLNLEKYHSEEEKPHHREALFYLNKGSRHSPQISLRLTEVYFALKQWRECIETFEGCFGETETIAEEIVSLLAEAAKELKDWNRALIYHKKWLKVTKDAEKLKRIHLVIASIPEWKQSGSQ